MMSLGIVLLLAALSADVALAEEARVEPDVLDALRGAQGRAPAPADPGASTQTATPPRSAPVPGPGSPIKDGADAPAARRPAEDEPLTIGSWSACLSSDPVAFLTCWL
ncbi:MAG: hypothetical protein AAF533_03940 [Acidobacteriota bacterium]